MEGGRRLLADSNRMVEELTDSKKALAKALKAKEDELEEQQVRLISLLSFVSTPQRQQQQRHAMKKKKEEKTQWK